MPLIATNARHPTLFLSQHDIFRRVLTAQPIPSLYCRGAGRNVRCAQAACKAEERTTIRRGLDLLPDAPFATPPLAPDRQTRIAVVGAGVSGLGAALSLCERHQVTVYEAHPQPGGHAHTVQIDYDGTVVPADIGFMVFAPSIYPQLTALIKKLGLKSRTTSMSFGVSDDAGLAWSWTGKRDPRSWMRNGLSTPHRNLFLEILRFNTVAKTLAREDPDCTTPLAEFLASSGLSPTFARAYGLPLVCAIWSVKIEAAAGFPAGRLCRFLDRHRLLYLQAHRWRSIIGGSTLYVEPVVRAIGDVRCGTPVSQVKRRPDGGVEVCDGTGKVELFDSVIFATHPDDTLTMLADADDAEHAVLGAVSYQANEVVLHRDPSLMPANRALWAAWNVGLSPDGEGGDHTAVTYWLNRLQGVPKHLPLFVTVNPPKSPSSADTFGRWNMSHFELNAAAVAAQRALPTIQGRGGIWHCGAWTADGFHEDGLASGLSVASAIAQRQGAPAHEAS